MSNSELEFRLNNIIVVFPLSFLLFSVIYLSLCLFFSAYSFPPFILYAFPPIYPISFPTYILLPYFCLSFLHSLFTLSLTYFIPPPPFFFLFSLSPSSRSHFLLPFLYLHLRSWSISVLCCFSVFLLPHLFHFHFLFLFLFFSFLFPLSFIPIYLFSSSSLPLHLFFHFSLLLLPIFSFLISPCTFYIFFISLCSFFSSLSFHYVLLTYFVHFPCTF